MLDRDTDMPDERRIKLRIGVNLGDVIAEPEDIYGDGSISRQRLEALAEPGGICISGQCTTRSAIGRPILRRHGRADVKNIARPVRSMVESRSRRRSAGQRDAAYVHLAPSAYAPVDRRPAFTNLSDDAGSNISDADASCQAQSAHHSCGRCCRSLVRT